MHAAFPIFLIGLIVVMAQWLRRSSLMHDVASLIPGKYQCDFKALLTEWRLILVPSRISYDKSGKVKG